MKVIFVCSPYSGDVENNTELARKYSRRVVDLGHIPIVPHLLFPQFMDEKTERQKAIEMNLALLEKCNELWIFGKQVTIGMEIEIEHAKQLGKRIVTEQEVIEC